MFSLSAVVAADSANARIGRAQLDLLSAIARVDEETWRGDGARDLAHRVSMRYGVSHWKASRWVAAGRALSSLPLIGDALASGSLSLDKVVELARCATPEDEARLIRWAQRVSPGAVRHRADVETRRAREDGVEVERTRSLSWWYLDDERRFAMQAELPAAEGAVVARALERLSRSIAVMPGEEGEAFADARRADALVALCGARVAEDPDPDRATVVVHAQLEGFARGTGAELEDRPAIDPSTVERLMCTSRGQTVVEDRDGTVVRMNETSRLAPAWLLRHVRYRNRGCTFPGCGAKRFTEAHHLRFWRDGGRTTLENLALICSFHHRTIHEHGWRVERAPDGELTWLRPDGVAVRAGPRPRAPADLEHIA
jgi:hypothetical protein